MTKGEVGMDKKDDITKCKYCGARFIPSLTASTKDTCHACIMANL
jgi:hypothetical protein